MYCSILHRSAALFTGRILAAHLKGDNAGPMALDAVLVRPSLQWLPKLLLRWLASIRQDFPRICGR